MSSFEEITTENASNRTSHQNVDFEEYELSDAADLFRDRLVYKYSLPLILFVGILSSLFPLTILIRRQMWLQHEGYVYLTALIIANILLIMVVYLPLSVYFFSPDWHIADTVDVVCKLWTFLAHVIVSTDWLLVALLVDVYLRCHLLAPRRDKCSCLNFAAKYCTLFGAKFVTGSACVAFLLVNWWRIVASHLFSYSNYSKICHLSLMWYHELWLWRFVSHCLIQYVPVVVFTPMLCVMIVFAKRRYETSLNQRDVANSDDTKQLTRVSLAIASAVFLLKCPHIIVEVIAQTGTDFDFEFAVAWYVTEFLASIHLIVVPALSIGMLHETRAAIRSLSLDRFGHRRL